LNFQKQASLIDSSKEKHLNTSSTTFGIYNFKQVVDASMFGHLDIEFNLKLEVDNEFLFLSNFKKSIDNLRDLVFSKANLGCPSISATFQVLALSLVHS